MKKCEVVICSRVESCLLALLALLVDNKNWNETFDYFYWCEYWSRSLELWCENKIEKMSLVISK